MVYRSLAQLEQLFRLNYMGAYRPQGSRSPYALKRPAPEFAAQLTAEQLQSWWRDHTRFFRHPAALNDAGDRYLKFVECVWDEAPVIRSRLEELGFDSGTVQLPREPGQKATRPRVVIYIAPAGQE